MEENEVMIEIENVEDAYEQSYEALDSSIGLNNKISEFKKLLENPRYDEIAVRVKKKCFYRYLL